MTEKKELIEIYNYQGFGFLPLFSFEDWRVAVLRAPEENVVEQKCLLERHFKTDEVFILTEGNAKLLLAGNREKPEKVHILDMQQGVVYNVKLGTWHGTLLEKDTNIILVEKKDTGLPNDTQRLYWSI